MKKIIYILLVFAYFPGKGQELFPLSEPASTMPKGTIGVRVFSELYKELPQWRNMTGLRIMYGFTPKLTGYITAIASNHHGKNMPPEFPFHNTPERGAMYPYLFNGVHLYAKYRLISQDGLNKHFRTAIYTEGTYVNVTHHETEPNLMMGDNKGIGGGIINTLLINKLAISLTTGLIFPFKHEGLSPDPVESLDDVPVRIKYGNSLLYHLSLGYLVYPKKYSSYKQTNINLYLELHGKAFQRSMVDLFINTEREYLLHPDNYPPALQKGYFADLSPGIQFILNSNLRIDCSVTMQLMGKSYARLYPVYTVGIQRYFYR